MKAIISLVLVVVLMLHSNGVSCQSDSLEEELENIDLPNDLDRLLKLLDSLQEKLENDDWKLEKEIHESEILQTLHSTAVPEIVKDENGVIRPKPIVFKSRDQNDTVSNSQLENSLENSIEESGTMSEFTTKQTNVGTDIHRIQNPEVTGESDISSSADVHGANLFNREEDIDINFDITSNPNDKVSTDSPSNEEDINDVFLTTGQPSNVESELKQQNSKQRSVGDKLWNLSPLENISETLDKTWTVSEEVVTSFENTANKKFTSEESGEPQLRDLAADSLNLVTEDENSIVGQSHSNDTTQPAIEVSSANDAIITSQSSIPSNGVSTGTIPKEAIIGNIVGSLSSPEELPILNDYTQEDKQQNRHLVEMSENTRVRDAIHSQVTFTAIRKSQISSSSDPITFDQIVSNLGAGFSNPYFIAPYSGLYAFQVNFEVVATTVASYLELVYEEEVVLRRQMGTNCECGESTLDMNINIHLVKGEKVWLRLVGDTVQLDGRYHLFSGRLLVSDE